MKLNFWQWLGIVLVVSGGVCYLIATNKHAPDKPAATARRRNHIHNRYHRPIVTELAPSSMRRDVISAYLAAGMKIFAWAFVSRITFLQGGAEQFGILALVRSTIGVLNYTTLGIGPAMVHLLAQSRAVRVTERVTPQGDADGTLSYRTPDPPKPIDPVGTVYTNGLMICLALAGIAYFLVRRYTDHFNAFAVIPAYPAYWKIQDGVEGIGIGLIFRLFSDAPGAALQARGWIWIDNLLLTAADAFWAWMVWYSVPQGNLSEALMNVAGLFAASGGLLMIARLFAAAVANGTFRWERAPIRLSLIGALASFGVVITIGQLADFLYAPVDFILINRLISPETVAIYAPAVQIDAALLVLVGGVASVMLPRAAIAHAAGHIEGLRSEYIRATLATLIVLLVAALTVWLASPLLFRLWLSDPMRPTQLILPLVLIHTVIGGSSTVGRSILLGMGKVKPFTIAVLIGGTSNVVLSYIFVRYCGLGLKGIVLGTIVAVVGRCAVWMPWYILRQTARESRDSYGN